MDRGPFRAPQSSDRRVTSRPEQAYRPPDEPQAREDQRPVQQVSSQRLTSPKKHSKKRLVLLVVCILLTIAIVVGGVFAWLKFGPSSGVPIDSTKYQAVFFTNGQVYFGKLQNYNANYFKLTDIFYLQTQATTQDSSQNPQKTSTDQNNVQLIKLGEEIHGPEDTMVISKDQVLFYEDLKSDGKVARSIDQYKRR